MIIRIRRRERKMSDFKLSEKTFVCDKSFVFGDEKKHVADVNDIKEFVKKIKQPIEHELNYARTKKTEIAKSCVLLMEQIIKKIDKLAGGDLI